MKLSDIFDVEYPPTLIYSKQTLDPNGINFVSSSGQNNGVVGKVRKNSNNKLFKTGSITVPLKGSVLTAFVQPENFYAAHQIAVLAPKNTISLKIKHFYCLCIRKNTYRYNYGRQADRTLKDLELPNKMPDWVNQTPISKSISKEPIQKKRFNLSDRKWINFRYDNLFKIERGRGARKKDITKDGTTPFVTSIDNNNGWTGKVPFKPQHISNVIGVNRNGSIAEAFYQPLPFCATEDVHVFKPKFKFNQYRAMFLISLIRKEQYRYSFGRKWGLKRMNESIIKLPVDENNNPDWQFMEDYIKSLPYSSNLEFKVILS